MLGEHITHNVEGSGGHSARGNDEIGTGGALRSAIEGFSQLFWVIAAAQPGDVEGTGGMKDGVQHGAVGIGQLAVEKLLAGGNDGDAWYAVELGGSDAGG